MQDPLKQGLKLVVGAFDSVKINNSNARSTKTRIETSRDSQKFRIVLYSNARSTKTRIETAHTVLSDHHSQKFECKIH